MRLHLQTITVAALVAIGLASTVPAHAQVYGQFTGAEPLPVNGRLFGAYFHSSENSVGVLGQLRLSFYPNVDFGFQGGFARQDFGTNDITAVRLGGDFKVGVMKPSETRPISVALGACIGIEAGDDYNILSVGPTVVASRAFVTGSGTGVTPYGRVGILFSSIDVGSLDDTDLSMPVRLGGDFRFGGQLGVAVELQLNLADSFNDDFGIAAGVNLPF